MSMKLMVAVALMGLSGAVMADARLTLNTGVGHFPYDAANTNNEFKRNVEVDIVQSNGGDTASGYATFDSRFTDSSFLPDVFTDQQRVVTTVTGDQTGQACTMTTDNDTYTSYDWTVTVKRSWWYLTGTIVCRDGIRDE